MESAFKFTNPVLVDLSFMINENFNKEYNTEVHVQINMSVTINRKQDINEAEVALKIELGEKSSEAPFFITVTEMARFKWEEMIEESLLKKLLNQNAPSLLLGYIRPIVAQLTAASPFGTYNIPFINFSNQF